MNVLVQAQLFGIAGLVIALVLETLLFIARATGSPGVGAKYESLVDPKRWALKQQPAVPIEGETFQTVPGQKAHGSQQNETSSPLLVEDLTAEGKKER